MISMIPTIILFEYLRKIIDHQGWFKITKLRMRFGGENYKNVLGP